jgi:hypothetical protein
MFVLKLPGSFAFLLLQKYAQNNCDVILGIPVLPELSLT